MILKNLCSTGLICVEREPLKANGNQKGQMGMEFSCSANIDLSYHVFNIDKIAQGNSKLYPQNQFHFQ